MFSLRTLFVVVTVAAFAVAALVADNYGLICGFVLLTIGLLCWSFLERAVPFWRGLCVFGLVYMLCAFWSPWTPIENKLPSTWLYKIALPPLQNPYDNPFDTPPPRIPPAEIRAGKLAVSHSIAALIFGSIGGLLYQWHTSRAAGKENG